MSQINSWAGVLLFLFGKVRDEAMEYGWVYGIHMQIQSNAQQQRSLKIHENIFESLSLMDTDIWFAWAHKIYTSVMRAQHKKHSRRKLHCIQLNELGKQRRQRA